MIVFLATVATIGALTSIARLIVALLDYMHRWHHLPTEFYGKRKGAQ